jgi:hypothetical protein
MEEKERHMLEDMFFKMLHEEGHIFDRLAFYEEFTYRTLDLLESYEPYFNNEFRNKYVYPFIDLLEHFETIALEHKKELLCGFFFALVDMLTMKFEYAKMPNEKIDREEHVKEMIQLKEKYGWNNVHVIKKKTTQEEL